MVRTSWVYNTRKEDLIAYTKEFGLLLSDTVEELRKTLSTFVTEHGEAHEPRLLELEAKHARTPSPARAEFKPGASKANAIPLPAPASNQSPASTEANGEKSALTTTLVVPTRGTSPNRAAKQESEPAKDNGAMTTRGRSPGPPHEPMAEPKRSYAAVMDKVRKWSVRFDGNKDPLVFVDRVTELSEVYDIPLDWLPRTMPELLKDRALLWHRNNNKHWQTWQAFREDFLRFFLPPRYFERLEDTIRGRYQQPRESFNDYVIALLDIMRPTTLTNEQQLERIYRNSRQEYQLNVKRKEFDSLDELIQLAGDYEEVLRHNPSREPLSQQRPYTERNRQLTSDTTAEKPTSNFNPRDTCRRCGIEGHFARGCQNAVKIFCWRCGKDGIKTIECCEKRTGNATGARDTRGLASPRQQRYPRTH